MDIVKKNLVSFTCAGVAILAVAFTFFPMGGFFADLSSKLDTSANDLQQIKSLNQEQFAYSFHDIEKGEQKVLDGIFPTQPVIDKAEKIVKELSQQSAALMNKAIAMNRHAPLEPAALGKSQQGYAMARFRDKYYQRLDQLRAELDAIAPPTQEDVEREKERLWTEVWEPRITMVQGQAQNAEKITEEFETKVLPNLADQLKLDRARHTMYLTVPEVSLDYHPAIPPRGSGDLPKPVDIWAAQLGLWIQEDVIQAIRETNATLGRKDPETGKITVQGAVVKRLNYIQIPKEYITATGRLPIDSVALGDGRGSAPAVGNPLMFGSPLATPDPSAAPTDPASAPKDYTISCTGRVGNTTYDVMHFSMSVVVDSRHHQAFMANLTRNKFITILRADAVGLDREYAAQRGYLYGPDPVMRLTLDCEAIFFRDWTKDLMPPAVQSLLGIGAEAAALPVQ